MFLTICRDAGERDSVHVFGRIFREDCELIEMVLTVEVTLKLTNENSLQRSTNDTRRTKLQQTKITFPDDWE